MSEIEIKTKPDRFLYGIPDIIPAMSEIEIRGDKFLKKTLNTISLSQYKNGYFQVPSDEFGRKSDWIEEIDLDGALERWFIQPKDGDSPEDLEAIYRHNIAVRKALEQITGTEIRKMPFFEGKNEIQ